MEILWRTVERKTKFYFMYVDCGDTLRRSMESTPDVLSDWSSGRSRIKTRKMASTAAGDDFDSWLIVKLKALNTDETVFSSYIKGILEGDEADDEKNESLDEILSEITVRSVRVAALAFFCFRRS